MINLTEADKFYIENNKGKSVEDLSAGIKKGKELIQNYLLVLEQSVHVTKDKKGETPLYKKLAKRKGIVVMTADVTMASEELAKNKQPKAVEGKDVLKVRND